MKTMTEQECRAFVMSGFIPTSNEDIADIQDCFNHQSVDFQIGLLLDKRTRAKAERLMRECLHCPEEVDSLIAQADDIEKQMSLRQQYREEIVEAEAELAKMRGYMERTKPVEERYLKYMCN